MLLYIWISIGILFLTLEILTTSFFLIFFGIAALIVALIVFYFSISLSSQILLFTFIAFLLLFLGRKVFKKTTFESSFEPDILINQTAIVLEDCIGEQDVKVMVGDTVWTAHAKTALKKNQKVKIVSILNLTLEIQPL